MVPDTEVLNTDMTAVPIETAESDKQQSTVYESKPIYDFFKRIFDFIIGLVCLTLGFPILLVIAIAIVLDDFGSPFFVQDRVGKNGKIFKMLKFRTMYKNAEEIKVDLERENEYADVHFKIKHDPRITRVGRFLRDTSLDETLQCVNLLIGNMSLVGPRPFVESEQKQLPSDRLSIKPGITCYWQLADTVKMPIQEQLELDYRYMRERSFKTDCKLILQTVGGVFKKSNC